MPTRYSVQVLLCASLFLGGHSHTHVLMGGQGHLYTLPFYLLLIPMAAAYISKRRWQG